MKMPIAYLDVAARYVELAPHLIFRTPTVADLGSPVGLYLEQPWVGLTEKEMWEAVRPLCDHDQIATALVEVSKDEYRAIETKLKEKNT
jgi:hypothetical protein